MPERPWKSSPSFSTGDATGTATQTGAIPLAVPPGLLLAVQGVMGTTTGFPFRLTAAFQLIVT